MFQISKLKQSASCVNPPLAPTCYEGKKQIKKDNILIMLAMILIIIK